MLARFRHAARHRLTCTDKRQVPCTDRRQTPCTDQRQPLARRVRALAPTSKKLRTRYNPPHAES